MSNGEAPKYDMVLIKTFIEGTLDTFKVQCSIDAKVGKPFRADEIAALSSPVELVGIIGLTSKNFNGSIAICFPEKTFLGVMGGMLGETYTAIDKDLEDGAGELLNIIFGYAKRVLNAKDYEIAMAIPSVVRGKDLRVQQPSKLTPVVVPFSSPIGDFFVKVAVS